MSPGDEEDRRVRHDAYHQQVVVGQVEEGIQHRSPETESQVQSVFGQIEMSDDMHVADNVQDTDVRRVCLRTRLGDGRRRPKGHPHERVGLEEHWHFVYQRCTRSTPQGEPRCDQTAGLVDDDSYQFRGASFAAGGPTSADLVQGHDASHTCWS